MVTFLLKTHSHLFFHFFFSGTLLVMEQLSCFQVFKTTSIWVYLYNTFMYIFYIIAYMVFFVVFPTSLAVRRSSLLSWPSCHSPYRTRWIRFLWHSCLWYLMLIFDIFVMSISVYGNKIEFNFSSLFLLQFISSSSFFF